MQSNSFLQYQRRMKMKKGRSNAKGLFGIEKIPCDNPCRALLDSIAATHLFAGFESLHQKILDATHLRGIRLERRSIDGMLCFNLCLLKEPTPPNNSKMRITVLLRSPLPSPGFGWDKISIA